MAGVSVALPVHRDRGTLARAAACITAQTHADLDIMLVLNGADGPTRAAAGTIANRDRRVRVLELPEAGLSAALNRALREARHDLVARMDADDECQPARLSLQTEFLAAHPGIVALGTGFEGVDEQGGLIGIEHPPLESAEIRWRLCLGNCLCHGSMMLRREAVLAAGGYDESLRFAQDYDLWLRLSREHELANLPHVLYRYRTSLAKRHEDQARAAADAMVRHWETLPSMAEGGAARRLATAVAEATWGGTRARTALHEVEALLTEHGPSPRALLAWQWIAARAGNTPIDPVELERLSRIREAGRRLRSAGADAVWLYGAGRHTAWLMENRDALGMEIAGLADDALAGETRHGFGIVAPADLPPRCHVLLSSDAHEDRLWRSAACLRQRGVTVWRLYARGEPTISSSGISPPGLSIGA